MKKISRRNFLKVTAAGAVGAATLSLTGCGGSKDNGTTAGSTATSGAESKDYNLAAVDSSKNTEVILWHNRGGKAGELLEQTMIPKFNETVGNGHHRYTCLPELFRFGQQGQGSDPGKGCGQPA